MKVILLQNVPKVGKRFEVRDVSDGFATNYLIPRRLAEAATSKKLKSLEERVERERAEQEVQSELLQADLTKLSGKILIIQARANEQGHLFKGIHEADVQKAIETQFDVHLPDGAISLVEPIKEIGEHALTISVGDASAALTARVESGE